MVHRWVALDVVRDVRCQLPRQCRRVAGSAAIEAMHAHTHGTLLLATKDRMKSNKEYRWSAVKYGVLFIGSLV